MSSFDLPPERSLSWMRLAKLNAEAAIAIQALAGRLRSVSD
jgi:hypothetical protein